VPDYIGRDECRGCHQPIFANFEATPHFKTTLPGARAHPSVPVRSRTSGSQTSGSQTPSAAAEGCESCHGPGREHAERLGDPAKIVRFAKLTRADAANRCLTCHEYTEEHGSFRRSAHKNSAVSCLDCHSVHHAAERQYLLRKPETQLCSDCHANVIAEFARPFHHRVEEKLITCTECHAQHGSLLGRQLRSTASQETICGKCHAETVGPFVFEHAPQKTNGCETCHQPHGSVNPRLLKRAQVNLLCLECHTLSRGSSAKDTPVFHNQDTQFQACTLCHTAIHGSNVSEKLLR